MAAIRARVPVLCRLPMLQRRRMATRHQSQTTEEPSTTHFGAQYVPEAIKESLVGRVFSSVASNYDTMNDVMSAGIHRLWKDYYVSKLDPGSLQGLNILDVAGGTGDIAFRLLDWANDVNHDSHTRVTVADINKDMLKFGKQRADRSRYAGSSRLQFIQQNAEELPDIPDSSVDLYTIAFGIRNCTHIPKVLEQAYRVLKPGGVFSCLEFSKVHPKPLADLYHAYSFSVIPLMGSIVAGDRDSYQYLVESIERFPSQPDFARMISDAGFELSGDTGYENLTFGVAAIHTGVKCS